MDYAKWVELRKKLKEEWKSMWSERIDDRFRAEGIAKRDYDMLFIDRGTVIVATRNARIPTFREILEMWAPPDVPNAIPPDPSVGGWGKFIRTELRRAVQRTRRSVLRERPKKSKKQRLKKGGRGWLHMR